MYILTATKTIQNNDTLTKEYKTKQGALNYAKKHAGEFATIKITEDGKTLYIFSCGVITYDYTNKYQLTIWYDDGTDVDYLDVCTKTKADIENQIIKAIQQGYDVLSVDILNRDNGLEGHIQPHVVEEYKQQYKIDVEVFNDFFNEDVEQLTPLLTESENTITIEYQESKNSGELAILRHGGLNESKAIKLISDCLKVFHGVKSITIKNGTGEKRIIDKSISRLHVKYAGTLNSQAAALSKKYNIEWSTAYDRLEKRYKKIKRDIFSGEYFKRGYDVYDAMDKSKEIYNCFVHNLRMFTVDYIPATDYEGSKVKITDNRNHKSIMTDFDTYFNSSQEIATHYLQQKGIDVLYAAELLNGTIALFTMDFKNQIK